MATQRLLNIEAMETGIEFATYHIEGRTRVLGACSERNVRLMEGACRRVYSDQNGLS